MGGIIYLNVWPLLPCGPNAAWRSLAPLWPSSHVCQVGLYNACSQFVLRATGGYWRYTSIYIYMVAYMCLFVFAWNSYIEKDFAPNAL